MSESPRKRQRISTDAYRAVDSDQEDITPELAYPTTPTRRASYLSPTKASLARSHPDILAKSPHRGSRTEPRGKLLREELLGSRRGTDGSNPVPKTASRPSIKPQNQRGGDSIIESAEKDGFAQEIAQYLQHADPVQSQTTEANTPAIRSPLRSRQPSNVAIHREDQARKPSSVAMPVPKLVKRQIVPARQQSETRNEPDLPPTPIQLGIGKPPDRPRGLASSSSMGSRSGSGKHRRRVREGDRRAITSSPLKPKNTRPLSPIDFSEIDEIDEIEKRHVEEAPESDDERVNDPQQGGLRHAIREEDKGILPDEIREKEEQLTALRMELEKLKRDLSRDENLADQLQQTNGSSIDDTASELLKSFGAKPTNENLWSTELHPSFAKDPTAYLALFAPGSLQLEYETTTKRVNQRTKLVHKLAVSAPKPWLSSALYLSLDVEIDPESAGIDQITVAQPTNTREYGNFHSWIAGRLRSPLHKLDAGGIIWGAGRYFEACIQKARILRYLDQRFNLGTSLGGFSQTTKGVYTSADVVVLSRYLHRPQLLLSLLELDEDSESRSTQADSKWKQILLCYEINLAWTGETTTQIDISLTGINSKSQRDLKELFAKLLPAQGVVGALESVYDIMDNGTRSGNAVPNT